MRSLIPTCGFSSTLNRPGGQPLTLPKRKWCPFLSNPHPTVASPTRPPVHSPPVLRSRLTGADPWPEGALGQCWRRTREQSTVTVAGRGRRCMGVKPQPGEGAEDFLEEVALSGDSTGRRREGAPALWPPALAGPSPAAPPACGPGPLALARLELGLRQRRCGTGPALSGPISGPAAFPS